MVSYLILAGKAFPYNYTNLVKTGTLGREYKNLNGTIYNWFRQVVGIKTTIF